MRIQTNTNALNALRNVGVTEMSQSRSIEKLSSGFRLNRSGDDAAGMSIANSLRSNGRGLQQAQRNASQATSVLQIADGGTQTISTILDRMKELATESASSNVSDTDRSKVQSEFKSLQSEIDRIVGSTVYQGQKLLGGTLGVNVASTSSTFKKAVTADPNATPAVLAGYGYSNLSVSGAAASTVYTLSVTGTKVTLTSGGADALAQTVDVGTAGTAGTAQTLNFDKLGISFTYNDITANATGAITTSASSAASFRVGSGAAKDSDNLVSLSLGDLSTTGLGIDTANATVDSYSSAQAAIAKIDTAVGKLNDVVGTIGAAQNRLDYATASVNSLYQNTAAAESVIRDVDMAQEYANYSKLNILQQAGTAMLAQANSSQQSVLQLLR